MQHLESLVFDLPQPVQFQKSRQWALGLIETLEPRLTDALQAELDGLSKDKPYERRERERDVKNWHKKITAFAASAEEKARVQPVLQTLENFAQAFGR